MGRAGEVLDAVLEVLAGHEPFRELILGLGPNAARELERDAISKVEEVLKGLPPGEEPKSDGQVAREAMRSLLASNDPRVTAADRIEAAKVLLGRG